MDALVLAMKSVSSLCLPHPAAERVKQNRRLLIHGPAAGASDRSPTPLLRVHGCVHTRPRQFGRSGCRVDLCPTDTPTLKGRSGKIPDPILLEGLPSESSVFVKNGLCPLDSTHMPNPSIESKTQLRFALRRKNPAQWSVDTMCFVLERACAHLMTVRSELTWYATVYLVRQAVHAPQKKARGSQPHSRSKFGAVVVVSIEHTPCLARLRPP